MTTTLEDLETRLAIVEKEIQGDQTLGKYHQRVIQEVRDELAQLQRFSRENTNTLRNVEGDLSTLKADTHAIRADLGKLKVGQDDLKAAQAELKTTVGGVAAKLDALTNKPERSSTYSPPMTVDAHLTTRA